MNNNILLFSVSIEILNLLSLVGLLYLISTIYGTFKWRWSKEQVALLLLIVAGVWLFSVPMKRITGQLGWLIRYTYRQEHGESFWAEMTFFGIKDATYLMLWSYLNLLLGSYLLIRKQTIRPMRRVLAIIAFSLITLIYSASILYTLPTIDQLKQSPSQIATVVHPTK